MLIQYLVYPGDSLAATHARGNQPILLPLTPQFVQDLNREACPRRSQRVSYGNSPSVRIQFCLVDAKLTYHGKRLRGKGLVQFDDIDIIKLHPRQLKRFGYRTHRTDTHDPALDTCYRVTQHAGHGLEVEFLHLAL